MESVKLFYCVKLCDETNCFNNHIAKIYQIEDQIKSCFKTHLVRDKFLSYGFWHEVTVSEASHMQYLDPDGFIHVVSLTSKEPILGYFPTLQGLVDSRMYHRSSYAREPSFSLRIIPTISRNKNTIILSSKKIK